MQHSYDFADKVLKGLRKKIAKHFSQYKSLAGFDEINLLSRADTMFDKLEEEAEEAYMKIAKHYAGLYDQEKIITKTWLNEYLTSYGAVTTYQYKHEVTRKKYRMFEAYMATKLLKEIDKCMRLWNIQVTQATIEITDKAILDAARNLGYGYVIWHTEDDERVCKTCRPRDGKVYRIDQVPDKPHYNCRCWFEPIKSKKIYDRLT